MEVDCRYFANAIACSVECLLILAGAITTVVAPDRPLFVDTYRKVAQFFTLPIISHRLPYPLFSPIQFIPTEIPPSTPTLPITPLLRAQIIEIEIALFALALCSSFPDSEIFESEEQRAVEIRPPRRGLTSIKG